MYVSIRNKGLGWKKTIALLMFIIYSISALWLVLIGRLYIRTYQYLTLGSTRNVYVFTPENTSTFFNFSYWKLNINLIPFETIKLYFFGADYINKHIIVSNLLGNVILFLPFGLLPIFLRQLKSKRKFLIVSIATVLSIEILQFVLQVGMADIDDVILNLLGAIIGYSFYYAIIK